jgi:hypothetical protein
MQTSKENFPLNIIDYPAFYPQAYSDNLSSIVHEYVVNNLNGKPKQKEEKEKFYDKTLEYSNKLKQRNVVEKKDSKGNIIYFSTNPNCYKYENTFDMRSIITPNEETAKFYAKKHRKNTTKSLIQHNLEKQRELGTLNEAKQKFIELQQLKKQQKLERIYKRHGLKNSFQSHHQEESSSISPTGSPVINDITKSKRRELYQIMTVENKKGLFDLTAVIYGLQNYFHEGKRFLKKVNKKSFGFTIKITPENKENALKFIEDLETISTKPIQFCTITYKKTHYNFHVSCANPEMVEQIIAIYVKNYTLSGLCIKLFKH